MSAQNGQSIGIMQCTEPTMRDRFPRNRNGAAVRATSTVVNQTKGNFSITILKTIEVYESPDRNESF